jgi:hypothetical protein
MVGSVGTCQRLKGLAGAIAIVSGIFLAAVPVASRVNQPNPGTSTDLANTAGPELLQAVPDAVSFTDVPTGDTYTQSVRITNVSDRAFQIKGITPSTANFRITGILLPVVVAPGTSENFTISYQAREESHAEAQIRIVTSAGDAPLVLKARGNAVKTERELTASEAGIDFEDVAVGNSARKEVWLTNSGNRELRLSGILVSGGDFSVSGAGAVTLSPGQRTSVEVNFAPKRRGSQIANFKVLSAEGVTLLDLPLNAAGAASSQSVVRLNWEENPSSVGGYVIYRAADPSGPYMRLSSQALASAEYVDTGLAAGHTYYYVVTSVGADEAESDYSAPISATVPDA